MFSVVILRTTAAAQSGWATRDTVMTETAVPWKWKLGYTCVVAQGVFLNRLNMKQTSLMRLNICWTARRQRQPITKLSWRILAKTASNSANSAEMANRVDGATRT